VASGSSHGFCNICFLTTPSDVRKFDFDGLILNSSHSKIAHEDQLTLFHSVVQLLNIYFVCAKVESDVCCLPALVLENINMVLCGCCSWCDLSLTETRAQWHDSARGPSIWCNNHALTCKDVKVCNDLFNSMMIAYIATIISPKPRPGGNNALN